MSPSANAEPTGPATITCAKDDGTQLTANVGWDNSNIYFQGKGDIARLYCEGGHSGSFLIFISTSVPDGPLRFYNGVSPTPAPEPSPSPTPSESPSPAAQPTPEPSDTASTNVETSTSTNETQTSIAQPAETQTSTSESSTQTIQSETPTVLATPSDTWYIP